jgi:hypothetical protein
MGESAGLTKPAGNTLAPISRAVIAGLVAAVLVIAAIGLASLLASRPQSTGRATMFWGTWWE